MNISKSKRTSANQKFESIKAQMRDPRLNNLRSRLVRATAAGDADAVERIGYEIKSYTDRKHY